MSPSILGLGPHIPICSGSGLHISIYSQARATRPHLFLFQVRAAHPHLFLFRDRAARPHLSSG